MDARQRRRLARSWHHGLQNWPSDSAAILGLFFGINLLFNGSSLLALGLSAPKASAA